MLIERIRSKRPIAIGCTEDKIVESVTARILTSIYEPIFSANSFGFRPNLSCHHAIAKVHKIMESKQGFDLVVEIDLAKFFNSVNHRLLMKLLRKKIANKKLLSLIHRQLVAKIEQEDGKLVTPEMGTPQGGIVSPILANVFLHYVIDEWFQENYSKKAQMVRYADDAVFFFKNSHEASAFKEKLKDRIESYKLELNESKTKVVDLSQKSFEVFDFLGFTFYRGRKRKSRGRLLMVKTSHKKLVKAINEFGEWIKKAKNAYKTKELITLVNSKLRGHYQYFGFWCNRNNLSKYYFQVTKLLFKWLNRRSQLKSLCVKKFVNKIENKLVKPPEITNLQQLGWSPYV